jgi:hypothetical protein
MSLLYGTDNLYCQARMNCGCGILKMKAAGSSETSVGLCTELHSTTSQKAVVFIGASLSNLVVEGVKVPGISMTKSTDREKISASVVWLVCAPTTSIPLARTINTPPYRTIAADYVVGIFPWSLDSRSFG